MCLLNLIGQLVPVQVDSNCKKSKYIVVSAQKKPNAASHPCP